MALTKTDLVKHLSQELSVTQDNAGKMIQATFNWIQDSLVLDEDISFLGFGSFVVQKTAAREGRNPRSGDVIQIPEGKRVVFRSGKLLKEALKGQICNVI